MLITFCNTCRTKHYTTKNPHTLLSKTPPHLPCLITCRINKETTERRDLLLTLLYFWIQWRNNDFLFGPLANSDSTSNFLSLQCLTLWYKKGFVLAYLLLTKTLPNREFKKLLILFWTLSRSRTMKSFLKIILKNIPSLTWKTSTLFRSSKTHWKTSSQILLFLILPDFYRLWWKIFTIPFPSLYNPHPSTSEAAGRTMH